MIYVDFVRRNEQFKVALDKYRRAIDTDGHVRRVYSHNDSTSISCPMLTDCINSTSDDLNSSTRQSLLESIVRSYLRVFQ